MRYVCGIFGYPIHHTASPAIHNAAFDRLKLDGVYLPFEIAPQNLKKAVESIRVLGLTGVNVTIPYKEKVIRYLDELSSEAQWVGAVNTIKNDNGKLIGYNTDAPGFEQALKESWGRSLKGAHVVLVGAGGAARGVAVQAGISGAKRLVILNRGRKRLSRLMTHLRNHFPAMEVEGYPWKTQVARVEIENCDCIVNATSLGMEREDAMPVEPDWLNKRTHVYDLVYNPLKTLWVRKALEQGCRASGGLGMLLYQGALAFEIWTGRKAPIEVMRRALLNYLNAKY